MPNKTRIIVQLDSDTPKTLFLRGEGVEGLSWEKGVELKHGEGDEWIFETDKPFSNGAFKILANDSVYELGDNHPLYPGASIRVNPKFPD